MTTKPKDAHKRNLADNEKMLNILVRIEYAIAEISAVQDSNAKITVEKVQNFLHSQADRDSCYEILYSCLKEISYREHNQYKYEYDPNRNFPFAKKRSKE